MKPWLIGGIVVVAVAAGGYLGLDQYAQRRAPAEIDALIAANGMVAGSHGAVVYSLLNDRLTVEGVELQAKDPAALGWRKLQAAHLEVAGLDPLRIKAVLSFRWSDLQRQRAPDRLNYQGFTLEASDGTLFSAARMAIAEPAFEAVPASPTVPSSMNMIIGLTARSLEVSDVKIAAPSPQGSSDVAVEAITARGIGKGRVETLDIRNVVAKGPSQAANGSTQFKVDRLQVSGFDHRNLIDLAYDREVRDEPLRPLWDDITVTTFSVTDQVGEMKLGRLTFAGIKAKRGNEWKQLPTSLAAAKIEMDDFDIKVLKDRPTHVVISKLRFSGVEPGRLGSASVEGIAIGGENNEVRATLAGADLQDVDYADLTKLGALEDLLKVGTRPPQLTLRHFGIGAISVAQQGKEMGSLGGFDAKMTLDDDRLPIATAIKLDKLLLNREILHQGAAGQEIAALGYNQLAIDLSADGTYDRVSQDMVVNETITVGPQVGKIVMSVKFGKVPTGRESGTADEQMRRMLGMTLVKGEIRYEDESLTERVLRRNAVKSGMTPQQMRDGVVAQLRQMKQSMPPGSRNASMLDAVAGFIQQPRSLVLSIDPPRALSVQQIMDTAQKNPMDMPVVLGLSLR